jgi:hypothetical protein
MEDIEVPTEHLHEEINEKAKELAEKQENKWTLFVAISTALMAVLAALSSLFAGHHSDEAVIMQIKASDQWAFYQAKGIKAEIRLFESKTLTPVKSAQATLSEAEGIKKIAEDDERQSEAHLQHHATLASAVTFLQVAIAVSAIAIITRRRFLWYGGIVVAIIGACFFIMGII